MNGQIPKHRPSGPVPMPQDQVAAFRALAEVWTVRAKNRAADAQRLYDAESMEYRALFNGALILMNCANELIDELDQIAGADRAGSERGKPGSGKASGCVQHLHS